MSRRLGETQIPLQLIFRIATQRFRLPQSSVSGLIRALVLAQRRGSLECWYGLTEAIRFSATLLLPDSPTAFVRHLQGLGCSWSTGDSCTNLRINQGGDKAVTLDSLLTGSIRHAPLHAQLFGWWSSRRPAIARPTTCSAQTVAEGYAPGPPMAVSYRHSLPATIRSYCRALQYENTGLLTTTSGYI